MNLTTDNDRQASHQLEEHRADDWAGWQVEERSLLASSLSFDFKFEFFCLSLSVSKSSSVLICCFVSFDKVVK